MILDAKNILIQTINNSLLPPYQGGHKIKRLSKGCPIAGSLAALVRKRRASREGSHRAGIIQNLAWTKGACTAAGRGGRSYTWRRAGNFNEGGGQCSTTEPNLLGSAFSANSSRRAPPAARGPRALPARSCAVRRAARRSAPRSRSTAQSV